MKARDVVVVDGIRTAFGRAGEKGYFWLTRADDMVVRVIRELLRRNPQVKPEMVEENGMLTIVQNDKSIIDISPEQLSSITATVEQVRNRLISF